MRNEWKQIAMKGSVAALLLFVPLLSGCGCFRLPAIDPSGERIFLPAPNTTTFESCLPKPAFATPPAPPKCAVLPVAPVPPLGPVIDPTQQTVLPASLTGPLPPGRNQLKLTPSRVVAPVGSEVVLVAGYCGQDGYFVTKQHVEWTLTQDSVGHFVEVGQQPECFVGNVLHEQPKKLSSNYAIGRTSNASHVITRGNANPNDDVKIHKGQSWLSVTSPTEGNSHITVIAPKAEGWDQRRQSATIHWIDAQWVLPPPAIARAGQPIALTTNVSRATNSSPLTGWLVRYEIPAGTNAQFANGQNSVEVQTDAAGNAVVELAPRTRGPGSAQVSIQIIRPASASGELPRTPVGLGYSTVTWSAPGLSVNVSGPDSASVGSPAPFQIQVTNVGDLTAPDIVVSTTVPPNFEFVSSDPPGQAFTGQLQWQLGDLQARMTRVITLQLRAKRGGDARFTARAESRTDNSLVAEGYKDRTRVIEPALSVNVGGPQSVEVGQEVRFEMQITNNSDALLTNVTLTDRFDPGLAHVQGETSPIQVLLGNLGPRETQTKGVTFIARQPGQLCHTLEVTADGGHYQATRGCVNAIVSSRPAANPTGGVQARVTGQRQARLGEPIRYKLTVLNLSNVPLNRVQIICQFDDHLEPSQASLGYVQPVRGQLVWGVQQILPNGREERDIELRSTRVLPAVCRLTVTAEPNVMVTDQAVTEIIPETGVIQPNAQLLQRPEINPPPADDETKPTGALTIDITDSPDPIRVGQWATYQIVIKNERNVSDRQVVLTIEVPEGVDFERDPPRITGATTVDRVSPDGHSVELRPINEMRAGDVIKPYELKIKPLQAGKIVVRAKVRSLRSQTPVEDAEETTILAQ